MFGRKKDEKPKKNHAGRNLAQYGLFDVPTELSFDEDAGMDDSDSDLEAELLALTNDPKVPTRKKKKPLPAVNLDSMVAESMREIPSDEDLSGDEDDPSLMDELKELTLEEGEEEPEASSSAPPASSETTSTDISKLLEGRLQMYLTAEDIAKKAGETSRARRFNRGIKTLKDLIKQVNAGKAINNDDIPPEVSTAIPKKPQPSPENTEPTPEISAPSSNVSDPVPEPSVSTAPTINNELLTLLTERRNQYKIAALNAKKAGDKDTAISHMKTAKQFESVIKAVENGEPVDLSKMPGLPSEVKNETSAKEECEVQQNTNEVAENAEEGEEEVEVQLIKAGSVAEALEQRLQVYKSQEENAKAEGNSSKARRMGRIVKQFEQAIKQHKAGKPIAFDELPTPPGHAPIPGSAPPPQPPATEPISSPAPLPPPSSLPNQSQAGTAAPTPLPRQNSARKMGNQQSNTRIEKQVAMLMQRQREFKEAALVAKKKGEIAQAKELLRTAKGFDKVIDAARGGFPVDLDSLPIPASARSVLEDSFEVVLAEECLEDDTGTLEMLNRLEDQLTKQLKMCLSTRDHHKALGDVTGVNRFENLALQVTKDLDIVRLAYRTSSGIPKFHYENRSFSIVKCCTDLNDNDLELVIVRGINYGFSNPKDADTYVRIEFPWPQDDTYKECTAVIKDSNNPEYNATYTIPIQRSSRQCLRIFKRHSVKFEIYKRGGLFRSDQLLGTVNVKLQPLETHCELHDSFDIMDGRKKVGGKLEVHIRVRHPLVSRQVEQLNEKWLLLDH